MALLYRDTDRDWQQIGADDPFWGVLTAPEFRKDALTDESRNSFYATGVQHIDWLNQEVERHFGTPLHAGRALDFGCGVGRVAHAMPKLARTVIGLDVSPGMLDIARQVPNPDVRFQTALTDERFDWLHSFIVFQHIPPVRGMAILRDLLDRLQPGGWVTLHFTVARSEALRHKSGLRWLRNMLAVRFRKAGLISMFDYDLGQLTNMFYASGIRQMTLLPTDHGGHFGVFVIGRRDSEG